MVVVARDGPPSWGQLGARGIRRIYDDNGLPCSRIMSHVLVVYRCTLPTNAQVSAIHILTHIYAIHTH